MPYALQVLLGVLAVFAAAGLIGILIELFFFD